MAPGVYTGFCLDDKSSANQGRFIHFQALGNPGQVTINKPCPQDRARWMIYLRAAHHVVIQGFELRGAETPGDTGAQGPWAGIMLDGDFGRTGKLTHHIAFIESFSHHHAAWGLHSTDSHSVLLQNNVFGFSAREHSAYVSDGSDNYVIRRNVFQGSRSSGLQLNLDPEASLKETVGHPSLSTLPPYSETRAWAQTVIMRASQIFGERGFPDGKGENFWIENNVMTGNGTGGGGALNLAAFQHSVVQNNLIYGNRAHGIAQWDNRNPFDKDAVASPPETAEDAKNTAKLPLFGCHDNVFQHNTVLLSNPGRAAMLIVNGSYNTHLYNNIFINGEDASIYIDRTSALGFDASALVFGEVRYRSEPFGSLGSSPYPAAVMSVMRTSPSCSTCQPNVSRAAVESEFEGSSEEPWIIIQGNWWVLNAKRPDFRPKWGATTLRNKADHSHLVPLDMVGAPRTSADIGALTGAPEYER
ncbi:MAG: right-handed parallel beta-helix repeat-containing protein [Polyangiaceae bacterium]|nr:right-handed parallel beta-helix repeat-containing protein [Polyangiaceae bacterium]